MTLLIGPANCEQVLGVPWRRARDEAIRLGVRRVRLGRAMLLPAAELIAALERDSRAGVEPTDASADPAAELRAALGLRLVGGSR